MTGVDIVVDGGTGIPEAWPVEELVPPPRSYRPGAFNAFHAASESM